ncbi:D-aminoacyl-tRNA deacylase [Geoglobus acetivorans]|uniref:D-aminoacyl-tRNA deacylase n=1 Tax=Geoglobus acetivorans TaxID=565033 RepID=A0ABZ3H154_GEOAI|nr:D-aminoacyl-tRNA deacylase [Geoglobus acetivorans]
MKLIVCSKEDLAGQNIKNVLLSNGDFDRKVVGEYEFHVSEKCAIVEVKERLIYCDNLDERLSKLIEFDEIVFASRHSSKDGRKIVTAHVSGNVGRADYGGLPYRLAKPAPITMKNFSIAVSKKIPDTEYEFTLEATHHGPSEIKKPCAFYEIGSTEEEWRDEDIAHIVADAILEALKGENNWKVAVGVGGTHYVPRQTEIELNTVFAFAHNFPKYTFQDLTPEFLKYAIDLSNAEIIIFDEKSANSKVKQLIKEVAEMVGIEAIRSKEAKKYIWDT